MAKPKIAPVKFVVFDEDVVVGIVDLGNGHVRFIDNEYSELPAEIVEELFGATIAGLIPVKG